MKEKYYDPFAALSNVVKNNNEKVAENAPKKSASKKIYLIRLDNNEKIQVNKSVFVLGKSKDGCNYSISDNNSISRKHAEIRIKSGHIFIVDLNSTNKTKVNNQALAQETETEIKKGDVITLAKLSFKLSIE